MEVIQLLISSLPESSLGLLGALAVYLVININRKDTKLQRDEEYKLIKYRIDQLENQTAKLTEKIESVVDILNKIHVEMAKINKDK
jgi:CII-binding regulator of phage lambda lysogenization HflD